MGCKQGILASGGVMAAVKARCNAVATARKRGSVEVTCAVTAILTADNRVANWRTEEERETTAVRCEARETTTDMRAG